MCSLLCGALDEQTKGKLELSIFVRKKKVVRGQNSILVNRDLVDPLCVHGADGRMG